jgi:hypothetical protein
VSPDLLLWLMFALGTVAIGLVILIIMEQGKEKTVPKEKVKLRGVQPVDTLPQSVMKIVTNDIMNDAKDKLRLLDLEREILSYAVRRLYEANIEGKISEAERDRLALKYKMDLARINEEIERGESIVALNELERMQEDLVKLFSERFNEMNKKIDDLKLRSGLVTSAPVETIIPEPVKRQPQMEQPTEKEEPREESTVEEKAEDQKQPTDKTVEPKTKKASKVKSSTEPETSEAEKKVEEIVAEVEKVLKKLGQMEVEE